MKQTLLLFLLLPLFMGAQDFVRVEYRKTLDWAIERKKNESADDAVFREAEEKELKRPRYGELIASRKEAVYKILPKINNEQNEEKTEYTVTYSVGNQEPTYKSVLEKKYIVSQETYGKKILLTGEMEMYDWQITRESKEILGIKVRKATFYNAKRKEDIEIWYAPGLTLPFGPDNLGDTPGLVLEFTSKSRGKDSSTIHFVAIKLEPLEEYTFEKPTKGTKMSQDEYHKWLSEMNKKRRKMYSGGVETE